MSLPNIRLRVMIHSNQAAFNASKDDCSRPMKWQPMDRRAHSALDLSYAKSSEISQM